MIFSPSENQLLNIKEIKELERLLPKTSLKTPEDAIFQKGGRTIGLKYLESFLTKRHVNYMFHISKPELAKKDYDNSESREDVVEFLLTSLGEIYQ